MIRQPDPNPNRGFTLFELMTVVAVVGIIMSMALPNYLNSRKTANEAATISALRMICTAEEVYRGRLGIYATLADLRSLDLIDANFDDSVRTGYVYVFSGVSADDWVVNATPQVPGSTGDRNFYLDGSGVIRASGSGPAGPSDPPVE